MSDIATEQAEDEAIGVEVSDEALEAAAFAGNSGAYTQLGLCTLGACPG
jgi:hypothetical protein